MPIYSCFKNGDMSKITYWVNEFMRRNNLTIRMGTHTGQMLTDLTDTAQKELTKIS